MLTIKYYGIDGTDSKKFKDLGAVARYLKGQDQGPEYRRPGYLQGEYAQFSFGGFDWADVMNGAPHTDEAEYKPELINAQVKITWRKKAMGKTAAYADCWYGYIDGEDRATIYFDKPRDYPNPLPYHASYGSFGGGNRDAHFEASTLEEAKAWVARMLASGEEGFYKRRGYYDGSCNMEKDYFYRTSKHSHLYAEGYELGQEHNKQEPANRIRPDWL